jgi:hypothetical protein
MSTLNLAELAKNFFRHPEALAASAARLEG